MTSVDHHRPTADPDGGSTRLVVPVPELAHLVGGAHIALLDPFLATAEVDEGVVGELREILAEIRTSGFDGPMSIEFEGPEDDEAAVEKSLAAVRALWAVA